MTARNPRLIPIPFRAIAAGLAYLAALGTVGVMTFIAAIILAGPHAALLPDLLNTVVLVLGWLAVLGLPVLASRYVWRRLGQRTSPYMERNQRTRI